MRLRVYDPRVLAIDLRLRRFGYAVFEGPRRLLDAGASSQIPAERDPAPILREKLVELLNLWSPQMILLKEDRWTAANDQPQMNYLARMLVEEAVARSVDIRLLTQDQFKQTYGSLGYETRFEIASLLARIFPELAWQLPPERKLWESEVPRMAIFDAVALGFASWQHPTIGASLRSSDQSLKEEPFA